MVSDGPFDQLQTASLLGGPYATIKTPAPVHSLFVTSGTNPCVAYYYASEVSTHCHVGCSICCLAVGPLIKNETVLNNFYLWYFAG